MTVFLNDVLCIRSMKLKAVLVYHFSHFVFYGGGGGKADLLFYSLAIVQEQCSKLVKPVIGP